MVEQHLPSLVLTAWKLQPSTTGGASELVHVFHVSQPSPVSVTMSVTTNYIWLFCLFPVERPEWHENNIFKPDDRHYFPAGFLLFLSVRICSPAVFRASLRSAAGPTPNNMLQCEHQVETSSLHLLAACLFCSRICLGAVSAAANYRADYRS